MSYKWILQYVIKEKQKAAKEEVNKTELAAKQEGATEKKKKARKVRSGRRHKRGGM